MHIRRARPDELEAIGAVTVAAYGEFHEDDTSDYVHHLRDAVTRDREAELWVAASDDDRAVLGTVTICPPGSPWREIARECEGEFRMLAVAPEARGAGVGSALLDVVVEHFREDGAVRIVMSTLPRMRAAHRIYERAGFVRLPERDWWPTDDVHLITYALELS
jgi:GNAT superfamily N-acetyltransferase